MSLAMRNSATRARPASDASLGFAVLFFLASASAGCGDSVRPADTSSSASSSRDAGAPSRRDGAADAKGATRADATEAGCSAGQTLCGDACTSVTSDNDNCQACGHVCGLGATCSRYGCGIPSCDAGASSFGLLCPATGGGKICAAVDSDPENCGTCGETCAANLQCVGGGCGYASCAAVAKAVTADGGTPEDGDYTVLVDDGRNAAASTVYCHDMAGAPTEYLTLPNQTDANYSNDDGLVVTQFDKVRLRLNPLEIDPGDLTFATTTFHDGGDTRDGGEIQAIFYATAYCCHGATACGSANVDLTRTFFAVGPGDVFSTGGTGGTGTTTYGTDNQTVSLTGGGDCGWNDPYGGPDPFDLPGTGQPPQPFPIYLNVKGEVRAPR